MLDFLKNLSAGTIEVLAPQDYRSAFLENVMKKMGYEPIVRREELDEYKEVYRTYYQKDGKTYKVVEYETYNMWWGTIKLREMKNFDPKKFKMY